MLKQILKILLIFFLLLLSGCREQSAERIGLLESWDKYPSERTRIVKDVLKKYIIIGMNKDKIIKILGKPEEKSIFNKADNIVYCLGIERGPIAIDNEWLIIYIDRNHIAVDYKIIKD